MNTHETQPLAIRLKPCPPQILDYCAPHDDAYHLSMYWGGSDLPTGLHNVLAGLEQCAVEPRAASILCAKLFEAAPQMMLLAGEAGMVYMLGARQADRDLTDAEMATLESLWRSHAVEFVREQAAKVLVEECAQHPAKYAELTIELRRYPPTRLRAGQILTTGKTL